MTDDPIGAGTMLRVIADLVAWQTDLGDGDGRSFALRVVVDNLVEATRRLIDASGDCDLQNEAQLLIDTYEYLQGHCMIDLPDPEQGM